MPIDFRKNANILTKLSSSGKPKQPTRDDPFVADGYELHAHPDLVERLRKLIPCAEAGLEFAYGIPMLCTPKGRAFAIGEGVSSLSLFLPENESWGNSNADLGMPWGRGSAWATGSSRTSDYDLYLGRMLLLAYATAEGMDVGGDD